MEKQNMPFVRKNFLFFSPLGLAAFLFMQACFSTPPPPPPPMPEEVKHIKVVYGWPVTRELEETCKSVRMEKVSRYNDWWAIHRRAKDLNANTMQFVYECQYDCDVRFWNCGEKFLPDTQKDATKIFGDLIGKIDKIQGNEIIISGEKMAEKVTMGKILAVATENDMVYIEVTFPMMTVAKCKIVKGSMANLKPGLKVYTKGKKD
jgi:hypothetical protein